jgi:hypothetical protein
MRPVFCTICFFLSFFILSSNKQNIIYSKNGIEVYSVEESHEFKNAKLSNLNTSYNSDSQKTILQYNIENYDLKADSKNNLTGLCANSKDGQHIHFIADNLPYTALYKTSHSVKLDTGSHLTLSFLSRSHHQAIKNKNAFKLEQINVIKKTTDFDLSKPYLFYSRPKGTYVDGDTKEILLDFYIVNTKLSGKGNKVHVIIDSIHSFYIKEWKPCLIKGLAMGEHKIKLSLVDSRLKPIKSAFPNIDRKFILQETPKGN